MERPRILVVDESPEIRNLLRKEHYCDRYSVQVADDISDAKRLLDSTSIDLILTRFQKRSNTGTSVLELVRENPLGAAVIVMHSSKVSREVQALALRWLEDCLTEPFDDNDLQTAIDRSVEKIRLRRELASCGLVGGSEAMQTVFRVISKAASTSATVLITGESGTGKELVALGVHYLGPRRDKLFVPVFCGAIPESLLESQLFGHLKGAFTGATETREGFFDAADRGSLFLDEISETTPATQVKLLRVLQDKEIYPVGATQARKVDVRVLAATNKDLSELIGKGSFREDLYYRLNVIAIEMPPLRDRNDDLQILIHHFARRFAAEYDVPEPHFTSEALKVLKSYYWPGNVRELENVIQRVVLMTEGDKIDFADLPPLLRATRQKAGLHRTLAEVEREHIREVLASVENNKTRAAEILGIDRKTLRSKLTRTSAPSSPAGDG